MRPILATTGISRGARKSRVSFSPSLNGDRSTSRLCVVAKQHTLKSVKDIRKSLGRGYVHMAIMASSEADVEYQTEIQTLKEKIEKLQSALENPAFPSMRKNKLTDAEIMQTFENIWADMEQWVEAVLADTPPQRHTNYYRQIRRVRTPATATLQQLGLLNPELQHAENLQHLHLTVTIANFMYNEVFRRRYPVGLGRSERNFLYEVMQKMAKLGIGESHTRHG